MIFKRNSHSEDLYIILLSLSRNIFFYNKINLPDNFETRIYLMFIHFSILMIISKKKGMKFDQNTYDNFFNKVEYDLRELGFGDVTVNKKMKELNQILYDILLKLDKKKENNEDFKLNESLVSSYLNISKKNNKFIYTEFEAYFSHFFNFCFELPLDNMLKEITKFKY